MKGRAGVLESEIKQDVIRGDDVEAKKEELAEMQQKVAQAETAQINILADANNELEVAAKADQQTEPTDAKDEKIDNKDTISNKKVDTTVDTEEGKIMWIQILSQRLSTQMGMNWQMYQFQKQFPTIMWMFGYNLKDILSDGA